MEAYELTVAAGSLRRQWKQYNRQRAQVDDKVEAAEITKFEHASSTESDSDCNPEIANQAQTSFKAIGFDHRRGRSSIAWLLVWLLITVRRWLLPVLLRRLAVGRRLLRLLWLTILWLLRLTIWRLLARRRPTSRRVLL